MKKRIVLLTLTIMFAFATVGFAQDAKKATEPVKKEVKCEKKACCKEDKKACCKGEKKAECKGEKKACCKKGEEKACCKK